MKLLSIAIPCYNSENYMRKCIDSLLPGGEDVEIIIVDDGSQKDRTAEIADAYAAQYPTIVKVIHQENGGHGAAVNAGIENATGLSKWWTAMTGSRKKRIARYWIRCGSRPV